MKKHHPYVRRAQLAGAGVLAAALLVGCGTENGTESTAATEESSAASSSPAESETGGGPVLTLADPWIKAAPAGEMTAAFGTLTNETDQDITVRAATVDVSDRVELHETVEKDGQMVMQPKEGGFTIPAGKTHELAPGGDHVMIMELKRALKPGEELTVVLELKDGTSVEVPATVKAFNGADEKYAGKGGGEKGMDMSGKGGDEKGGDMSGMDMSGSDAPSDQASE